MLMKRITDKRFVDEGFYQPKNREERLEIFTDIPSVEDYGSVISLGGSGFFGKLQRRFRSIMTNRSGNVIMLVKKLWNSNIKNGSSYIPKIVDAFDVLDKDDTVIILIKVR